MSGTDADRRTNGSGRPEWVSAALFPYESHFTDVEECRLHYIDEGDVARQQDGTGPSPVAWDHPGFRSTSATG